MNKLAVSILAADFANLKEELLMAEQAGAHYVHIDVMDGHFVPNISVGVPVVESLRRHSSLMFDVHLMITNPEDFIAVFADAGSDIITFHLEAAENPKAVISEIKQLGKKAGISIKPTTPVEAIFEHLPLVDMVLLMSVEPGFGGQHFMPEALERARVLRKFITVNNLDVDIQMDGGITHSNAAEVIAAGVNIIVAGTAVFGAVNKPAAVKEILEMLNGGITK